MCRAVSKYRPGSIGHAMEVPEQEGKNAWLAGVGQNANPYSPRDHIRYGFWLQGWLTVDGLFKRASARLDRAK